MHGLQQINRMNEEAAQRELGQAVKINVSIEGDDFRVREDGLLEGTVAAAQHKPPLLYRDAIDILTKAAELMEKDAEYRQAVAVETQENYSGPLDVYLAESDLAVVLPVMLPARLLEKIADIEAQALRLQGYGNKCAECSNYGTTCCGIFHKGDMLKGILRLALYVGMGKLIEKSAQEGGEQNVRTVTAEELFNQLNWK